MREETFLAQPEPTTRRGFLQRLALIGAAVSVLPLLKNPFARVDGGARPIPADLPGEGSIFQPRNDTRQQR